MRRNYFVKRWILQALAKQSKPITANGLLIIIKADRERSSTSRRSPNLSSTKIASIMIRMPEVRHREGHNTAHPKVYWIKKEAMVV
tara:strand:+ start:567 stop:824 length:258 start_codon:yes stop_codon:yes gene_type:complete